MNKVIIDFSKTYIQAIKLSDDDISGYFAVASDSNVGDVFVGRVENVRGGQCFVNYDKARHNGILELRDRVLKSGDYIKCQVIREECGDKGAVLSDRLNFAGHFAVLSDSAEGIKFSRRLEEPERIRIQEILPETKYGFIIRKQAADADQTQITAEMKRLSESFESVLNASVTNDIRRLHRVESIDRILQELEAYGSRVICNKAAEFEGFEIEYYQGTTSIFEYFGLSKAVESIFAEKLLLKNAVELVFNRTEAMTVIDVNFGGGFGGNIDAANQAAAEQIVRQIRLRNLSGLILTDFISTRNTTELKSYVQALLKDDKEQSSVYSIKELSIIAINRKKRYNEFVRLFFEECSICGGAGAIMRKND